MQLSSFGILLGLTLTVAACGSSSGNYVKLAGDHGRDRILFEFQGAPAGTVCTVVTPAGTLTSVEGATGLEIPTKFRSSPLTCRQPGGKTRSLKVLKTIPAGAERTSAVTVHLPSGKGHSTYGNAQGQLVQPQWNANSL